MSYMSALTTLAEALLMKDGNESKSISPSNISSGHIPGKNHEQCLTIYYML
jgi:hypothetical protein